ncbi:tripartite tricarboxylate transporter substrate binding protein [Bordetella sp. BOR01]|uniref:tripartite tricarboxylate transporter substrate binding protein n=1 Tax=Bordetella sp. BOR01 TaxID=2854779 RepID=UPI001C47FD63|nr:tripartite tricarboxylate transporter substrate binding protein [Bordetella sp. BOR01]MBV7481496.1 tripartite tricarboxylate transporter substrate binding protein [Bordetella sp. BOR01]
MQGRFLGAFALSAAALCSASASAADTWPAKPITIVVPFSPGGANDLVARLYAKQIARDLDADVIVENRAGAGGIVGAAHVARTLPDGYTFLAASNGTVTNSLIRSDQPYKDEDIEPVALLSIVPSIIVTHPSNPATDLKDFVARARQHADRPVTFSTAGMGSTPDFVSAMVKLESGINVQSIPYKSGSEGVTAVMGGQTDMTSEASMVTLPLIQSGKLKALATTWDKMPSAPDIKTTAELGFPNIRIGHWEGLYARAGTPPEILDKVNAAVRKASQSREVLDTLNASSIVPGTMTRAEFTQFTQDERARLGKVVKAAHMQPD